MKVIIKRFSAGATLIKLPELFVPFLLALILGLFTGCASRYYAPTQFVRQIATADYIVVTNISFAMPGAEPTTNFSKTITGHDVKEIIHAISELREPMDDDEGIGSSALLYTLHLKFYRGNQLLGTAGLSYDLIDCDVEFHTSPFLRKLCGELEDERRGQD